MKKKKKKKNARKIFLQILKKYFTKGGCVSNIFNINTVKLSSSYLGNIGAIKLSQNKSILKANQTTELDCGLISK